jgi:hypothetical protein
MVRHVTFVKSELGVRQNLQRHTSGFAERLPCQGIVMLLFAEPEDESSLAYANYVW